MQPQQAEDTRAFDQRYLNRLLLIFVGLMFTVFYIETMLTPTLPSITSEFHISIAEASLLISLYAMSGTALVPVIGKLGDIYGKKRILIYVLFVFAASVSVTSFSPDYTFMLVARIIQGVGIAIVPLVFSLVREEFPRDRIPKAMGLLRGMNGAGLAVALPLGSLVSNYYGWQGTYHTAIPLVVLLAVMTYAVVRESPYRRPDVKVDYVGAALLGSSLAMVLFALAEGASWGWESLSTISLGALGAALLLPLVLYERRYVQRGGEPVLDLRLLTMRNVMVTNFAVLGLLGITLANQAFVYRWESPSPAGYGFDIFQTGLSLVPLALALFVFAPISGIAVSKVGVKPLGILGSLVTVVGFLLCAQASTYVELLVFMGLVGAGISVMISTVQTLLVLSVDQRDMGLANALNSVFGNLGDCIGAPIAGAVLSTFTVSVLVGKSSAGTGIYRLFPSVSAFQYCFYIAAAAFVAIAVAILFAHEVLGKRTTGRP
jgi:MFS family permease